MTAALKLTTLASTLAVHHATSNTFTAVDLEKITTTGRQWPALCNFGLQTLIRNVLQAEESRVPLQTMLITVGSLIALSAIVCCLWPVHKLDVYRI